MTCIITGCALQTSWDGAWAWGDLHEVGGTVYVFNACRSKSGETDWQFEGDLDPESKSLRILSGEASAMLELHGVIIVPTWNAWLNDAAKAYVAAGRAL